MWTRRALATSAAALLLCVAGAAAVGASCTERRLRCAYRAGCGSALSDYMVHCEPALDAAPGCPEPCQHALIALTSTEEGKRLMDCECDDDYCIRSKARIEMCRPQVLRATLNETVSCRVSQLICLADALCSTALEYYNSYCRSMFHGKKCSHRCLNSISILRKQEKAAKLATCKCDGHEKNDCFRVQRNMARLCFHKKVPALPGEGEEGVVSRKDEEDTARTPAVPGTDSGSGSDCVAAPCNLFFLALFLVFSQWT